MLLALHISNFAVIEEAEVSFGEGLTVLTGETGAGKSMVVDALSLLLGSRADPEVIRAGCEEAMLEGLFRRTEAFAERLSQLGLPDLGEEVSVRRVVGPSRARAYVNGALVTVGVLSQLMKGLIDVSGQHEHMSLFDPSLHRELLDRVGKLDPLLSAYRERYRKLRQVEDRLHRLGEERDGQLGSRLELIRFQLEELERLDPQSGEEERLEAERRRLGSVEKLQRSLAEADSLLRREDGSATELLDRALSLFADAARLDSALAPAQRRLELARAEMEDAGRELSRYLSALETDPGRLSEVEERLDLLRRLCRRQGTDLTGLLRRREELLREQAELEGRADVLKVLLAERADALTLAREAASQLSVARQEAASGFSRSVRKAMGELSMRHSELSVRVSPAERPEEALGPEGIDRVEFFFSANPGEPARPLTKVASGGEASRLMLALKRALADSDGCRCYVLDEADAGVGGAAADVVGRMIHEVSRHRQVLCITHLPQVAAHADQHLLIRKEHQGGRTISQVAVLERGEERTRELARMLSGVEVSPEALGAAQALVRSAQRARQSTRGCLALRRALA